MRQSRQDTLRLNCSEHSTFEAARPRSRPAAPKPSPCAVTCPGWLWPFASDPRATPPQGIIPMNQILRQQVGWHFGQGVLRAPRALPLVTGRWNKRALRRASQAGASITRSAARPAPSARQGGVENGMAPNSLRFFSGSRQANKVAARTAAQGVDDQRRLTSSSPITAPTARQRPSPSRTSDESRRSKSYPGNRGRRIARVLWLATSTRHSTRHGHCAHRWELLEQ